MQRQIKFRIWDNRGKYFRRANIEGPKNSAWGVKIDRGIFSLESTEGLVYQQWIGLLDANNKEIYEGDIVSYNPKPEDYSMYRGQKDCLILWKDDETSYGWFISSKKGGFSWRLSRDFCKKSTTVIGNIFENPELLSAV